MNEKGKLTVTALAILAVVAFAIAMPFINSYVAAESLPSSKTAIAAQTVEVLRTESWDPLLTAVIKTAEPTDLVIQVTAETALVTDVKLSGDQGSSSNASISVRVKVDGNLADPGVVVFDRRLMVIKGKLGTLPDGSPEWIQIYLATRSAHAFNFISLNVGSGQHTVVVEAFMETGTLGEASVDAVIGKRTVVVEAVRLLNSI